MDQKPGAKQVSCFLEECLQTLTQPSGVTFTVFHKQIDAQVPHPGWMLLRAVSWQRLFSGCAGPGLVPVLAAKGLLAMG